MTTLQIGATTLHDAVTPTKPPITPLMTWPTFGRRSQYQAVASAASPPAAAAKFVFNNTSGTMRVRPIALPPLKPNQLNQSSIAPIVDIGRLCADIGGAFLS